MSKLFSVTEINALIKDKKIKTPFYLYDQKQLLKNVKVIKKFNHSYGLTVRYAVKANPNINLIKILDEQGIHFDASSIYEARRLVLAGVDSKKIMLTAQEIPEDIIEIEKLGIEYNACSLRQLELYGIHGKKKTISIRINPGKGSGGNNRTNVGGMNASFGIWHEYIPLIKKIAEKYNLTINKLHTHIGSGSDPKVWQQVCKTTMALLRHFPDVNTMNLGGGFKVARYSGEETTDLKVISAEIKKQTELFYQKTGRKIRLEIEPGTYFIANIGNLVASVNDVVDTGKDGHCFIKLNTGMNDFLRVSLYGSQHQLQHISLSKAKKDKTKQVEDESEWLSHDVLKVNHAKRKYIVVGHCCESGDIFTTVKDNPEELQSRILGEEGFETNLNLNKGFDKDVGIKIGDLILIQDVGAYSFAMATKNYNSFPDSAEYLKVKPSEFICIRKRQTLKQMLKNESR